jgi:hypothetical protein
MGSTLTVDNIVGATTAANVKLPAGTILQTVTKDFSEQTSVTSSGTTYTDLTNGTITITPKFNNSKILIIPNITILQQLSSSTYIYFGVRCLRGSSTVLGPTLNTDSNGSYDYGVGYGNSGTRQFDMRVTAHHIDTPATTSATTYKFQVINYAAGRTTTVNHTGASSILAMEISV